MIHHPTQQEIKAARMAAGLSQEQAATMVHRVGRKRWSEWETGVRQMQSVTWELFLILTDQHPSLKIQRNSD